MAIVLCISAHWSKNGSKDLSDKVQIVLWCLTIPALYVLYLQLQQVDLMGITIKSLAEIEKEVSSKHNHSYHSSAYNLDEVQYLKSA